ncbi:MAG: hypothetical protein HFJ32_04775 [Clostridia bacterium]|nr:hypothetical protein [Clostridia bacterium]
MKKFKIIRNVLIVVVILVTIMYVCWLRSNQIESSKTAKLYNKMFEDSYKEQKNITMQISYKNEKMKIEIIQATDNIEGKEIIYFAHDNYDRIKKDPDSEGAVTYSVTTKDGISNYSIFPKLKKYDMTYEDKENDCYDNWISNRLIEITKCKYYTKGYEIVDGKILYCENFKEVGLKMYFDKDNLVYMKSTELDKIFNDVENALYTIKITYDDSYKKYTEIPKEYTGYTVQYNNETNEQERAEIK